LLLFRASLKKIIGNASSLSALSGRDVKSGDFNMINISLRPRSAAVAVPAKATATHSSDEMLVARIAKGDRLAMQSLFARHRTPVYRWLLRFVGNETVAEDLLSDVFLDVWRQADRFEGRSAVATWLLSIARLRHSPHGVAVLMRSWTR
jgi:Sigma-70 region 2